MMRALLAMIKIALPGSKFKFAPVAEFIFLTKYMEMLIVNLIRTTLSVVS